MEVFVKRENWDGGIWMKLPASEEQAEQVLEELAGYHPSRMIPFISSRLCCRMKSRILCCGLWRQWSI